jgi:hypothetical protein
MTENADPVGTREKAKKKKKKKQNFTVGKQELLFFCFQ